MVYANRAKLTADELMLRLSELEAAIRALPADGNSRRAEGLAMYIARNAPSGPIANLAMRVMSDVIQHRGSAELNGSLGATVSQLRAALEEAAP
jgi:hypothetical protein